MVGDSTSSALALLDATDRHILRILQEKGRIAHSALAEEVGLTSTPLRQRIDKMERAGIICGYAARVSASAVGRGITAFIHVTHKEPTLAQHRSFLERALELQDVLEVHHLAGEEDFLLKVVARDLRSLERFLLHDLTSIPGVARVKTTVVLSTSKNEIAIPIEDLSEES